MALVNTCVKNIYFFHHKIVKMEADDHLSQYSNLNGMFVDGNPRIYILGLFSVKCEHQQQIIVDSGSLS